MNTTHDILSLEERVLVIAKLFQSIPLYFAHWGDARIGEAQLDEAFAALAKDALACVDRRAFSLRVMRFVAQLDNGHTGFLDPALDGLPLGMAIRPIEGHWTVISSDVPDLRAGDVILDIEGKAMETWYDELAPYTVGSPQSRTVQFGSRNMIFPALLGLFLPDRYTVTYQDAGDTRHTQTIDRAALPGEAAQVSTEGRWLDERMACIRIPSFLAPQFQTDAIEYVKRYAEAACLIIDVRGNSGGSTPGVLIQALMNRPYRWWAESSPLCAGMLSQQGQPGASGPLAYTQLFTRPPATAPDPEAYRGHLLILVDRATWSAAEDFAMPFKDNGRATLIGETTGGSTGQPYYHFFDNGLAFAIGSKRACMPDGTKFEGVGIAPDIHVERRREDLYAGRDRVLEAAIALSRTQTEQK
jgi:carboxyl-terminal processing protease